MVAVIPPPNFNGPTVTPQPARAPMVYRPAPSAPRSTASAAGVGPRAWVPNAPARPWKWIVIHHSATPAGSAAVFDKMHKAKGWDELGYHFVIGNGTDSGNGEIEVGPRWPKQKWGAHAKTADNRYNDYGIGICLVGNFDTDRPTPQQLQALTRLTAYLMKTYHISANNVIGHGDTKPTDCPGHNMNVAQVRRAAAAIAEASDAPTPSPSADATPAAAHAAVGGELLVPAAP
jgi:hypothetical protein